MTKYDLDRDLYKYQQEDITRMEEIGRGILLLSEMGVGKTPETLGFIEKKNFQCPLIVCPNSLRLEWKRQIEEWVGKGITAVSTTDSYTKLQPIIESFLNGQKYKIINYETFRNKDCLEMLNMIPFDIIVFDEIHKIRNPKTKQVKGVWEFLSAHPNATIMGLSGSPIMNYPNDLYVPLSCVHPSSYPRDMKNWHYFMDRYCYWTMGKYGTYQYGSRRIDELREITKPFTIKRTKKEVLPYLPEKYFRRVVLEMPPDQRKLYDQMEKDLKILLDSGEPLWAQGVLALLTRLRQINIDPKIVGVESGSAKTDFLVDLIESMDEKLVVFSCFERYIHLLSLMYPDALVVTGEVKPDERAKRVKEFQEDPSKKLFFGTIQTAGEGITLTAASTVVMMDRWWNEPSNSQATDRLHRIGQVSAVEIIIPINENSVDESLDEILQRKGSAMQEFLPERDVTRLVVDDRRQRNEPRVIEL